MRELLLIAAGGGRYGIWKDEIQSITDLDAVHRLPLSPACIAGMSIIDGSIVTLADLPACIGHAPAAGRGKGRLLRMPGREKIAGFMVSGDIDSRAIPPEATLSMPDHLKTAVFDTCVVLDAAPVPVINLSLLYDQMLKPGHEPPVDGLQLSGIEPLDVSSVDRVRLFEIGGELYAAPSAGIAAESAKPGPISGFSSLPHHVMGLMFINGQLLPVIDLQQRIKGRKAVAQARMLLAAIGEAKYGLLIDDDEGTSARGDMAIRALPSIAQSSWLRAAVVRAEEIIPLLDPGMLLSARAAGSDGIPLAQKYTPDSQFSVLFRREDVDVVEFALLGVRHALPRSEVEDVIAFKPFRVIPDVPQIVVGVTEHGGEILPVLDLAMVFGRRSLATHEWRMLLVKNGDFRALVVTEAVFGERRISRDAQRAVPIVLPHRVVYGCYPDDDTVRLILNVEAMAVSFEKSLVRELLPALSREMKLAPAEIVESLLDSEAQETIVSAEVDFTAPPAAKSLFPATVSGEHALAETVTSVLKPNSGEPDDSLETGREEDDRPEETVEPAMEHKPVESIPEHGQGIEQPSTLQDAEAFHAPATDTPAVVEGAELAHAEYQGDFGLTQNAPPVYVENVAAEQAATVETATEPQPPAPDKTSGEIAGAERTKVSASADRAQEGTAPPAAQSVPEPVQMIPASAPAPLAQKFDNAEKTEPAHTPEKPGCRPMHSPPVEAEPAPGRQVSQNRWKRGTAYVAMAAMLAVILYFTGISQKPDVEMPVPEAAPTNVEPEKAQAVATMAETPWTAEKPEVPLELNVAADSRFAGDVYVVIKDDTLWSISARFTGTPYNYPRIAGENRIADPDLIFPGQKIRLKKN